jgi:predicted RNase H-like nuclease (RuvC/YqgF family)
MSLKTQLERKIQSKTQEIADLEVKLREARAYIQGLQDVLRMLPRDGSEDRPVDQVLRAGSDMARAREAILRAGKALHISDIMKALGKDKANKASLGGSLSNYVRKDEIFTRPAPNTFGLKELESETLLTEEPPPGFGVDTRQVAPDEDEINF